MHIRRSQEHGIVNVRKTTLNIFVRKTGNPGEPSRLWVGNRNIGYAKEGHAYPDRVTVVTMEPTVEAPFTGDKLEVASHDLPCRRLRSGFTYSSLARGFIHERDVARATQTPVEPDHALTGYERYSTRTRVGFRRYLTSSGRLRAGNTPVSACTIVIDYETAAALTPPVALFQEIEYTFHRAPDGGMTDLRVHFPPDRPFGRKGWMKHDHIRFAMDVRAENWPLLLRAIEGAYFVDINDPERLGRHIHGSLEEGPSHIRPGQCVDARLFDTMTLEVSLGDRLVYRGRRGNRTVYVVDGPNYGVGLYLFRTRRPALAWANGRITQKQARRRGRFVPHTEGWQQRARDILNKLTAR